MPIWFCCTNVDLYSYEELCILERLDVAVEVVHCLGLCHYCAQGRLAVAGDEIIAAADAAAFRQALSTYAAAPPSAMYRGER